MKPLPLPIRIAAGLAATALEEALELPRKLTELPVTAVSGALQASMRVQQRVTQLAIKGDRALGALRPVPETPSWARFDEDDPDPGAGSERLAGGPPGPYGFELGRQEWDPPRRPTVTPVRILDEAEPEDAFEPPVPRPRTEPPHAESDESDGRELDGPRPDDGWATAGARNAEPGPASSGPASSGPRGMDDYESWSLPGLRGRFRTLSVEQLRDLLVWETAHQDRPAYVTLLSNRIASVAGR